MPAPPSPGAPRDRVDAWKQIAGEGTLDERCHRIMGHWRHYGMPWDRPWWVRRLEERRRLARQRMSV